MDWKKLMNLVAGGLLMAVVPAVGSFFLLGLGMTLTSMGRNRRKSALRHVGEEVTPIARAGVEEQVRMVGTVISEPSTVAPYSKTPAALVHCSLKQREISQIGGTEVWSERRGDPFLLRDADGDLAMVDAAEADLLFDNPVGAHWSGEPSDEMAAILGDAATSLTTSFTRKDTSHDWYFHYAELVLSSQDEVVVVGWVVSAIDEAAGDANYRNKRTRRRLEVRAHRITNLVGTALHDAVAAGSALQAAGIVWLLFAVANAVVSYLWLA